jgi:DNA-binding MarR family transcriptional regulator
MAFVQKRLAKIVKLLYHSNMNKELKKKIVNTLMQVTRKFTEVEALPIEVTGEISVSTREAHAIESIGENRCVNVTQIADHFGFTKSAASQLVSKLTRQGFVVKKQAGHSNKELQLSLTPLGWQAFEAHAKMHGMDLQQVLETMDSVEISVLIQLNELMGRLNSIMDGRLAK